MPKCVDSRCVHKGCDILLSERIRRARKSRGLTQAQLAERLGMSEMTIRRWESSIRSPRIDEIQRIAEALSVSPDDLLSSGLSEHTAQIPIQLVSDKSHKVGGTNTGTVVLTLENGKKEEAPATLEGYAFLKDLFAMTLNNSPVIMV